jgi:hypothetical protein
LPKGQLALVEQDAPQFIEVKNHTYRAGEGPWLPGVTGILKVQDAIMGDGLTAWAAKLAAEAAFNHAKRPENPNFDDALNAALDAVNEPRNRGGRVHDAIDAGAKGEPYDMNLKDGPLYHQLARFLLREKVRVIDTEMYVVGDGYGGTYDMAAEVDGKLALLDCKTGKWKDSHVLQLAGYSTAQWQAPKPDGTPVTAVPKFEAFYVLLLSDTSYELREVEVGKAEIEHFRFLVKTHQQLHAWAKRNKGEAA